MLTTFARIAKILKGLVEPRNWVEEAFAGEGRVFHLTGSVVGGSLDCSYNDLKKLIDRGITASILTETDDCGYVAGIGFRNKQYAVRFYIGYTLATFYAPDKNTNFEVNSL